MIRATKLTDYQLILSAVRKQRSRLIPKALRMRLQLRIALAMLYKVLLEPPQLRFSASSSDVSVSSVVP